MKRKLIKEASMRKWRNFGDVDYIHEGGYFVRPALDQDDLDKHPLLATVYEVLAIRPVSDCEDTVKAGLKHVDIADFQDESTASAMLAYFGDLPSDPYQYAAYCAEYVGVEPGVDLAYRQQGMYSEPSDHYISFDAAEMWYEELGIRKENLS